MDSLRLYISGAINDTDRVNRICKAYADELWKYNTAEPYKMLKEALTLAQKNNFLRGELRCYNNMIGYSRNRGNATFAEKYAKEFMRVALLLGDSMSYGRGIANLAGIMRDKKNHVLSIEYLLRAKGIYERNGADKDQMARAFSHLGGTYEDLGDDSLSLKYMKQSFQLREEINYADGIDASGGQILGYYRRRNNYPMVIAWARKIVDGRFKVKDSLRGAEYLNVIGHSFAMSDKFDSAFFYLDKGTAIINRHKTPGSNLGANYARLYEVYEKYGDYKKAFTYLKLYKQQNDSFISLEKARSVGNTQALYDVEEKENTIKLLDQEKQIQEQDKKILRYILILAAIALLAVAFILFFIYKAYRQKREANVMLAEQKKIIEKKNKEVMDSINYAKRLQSAILIPEQELKKHFGDIFVLFKPKDIVSGDFYWFSESPTNKIIALADCTGHGVPGGFMSMLGYESLQDVALKENITTTSEVLKSLDRKITETLNKSGRSFRDGMDVALCAFSKNENILQFSGANRPLIQISEGVLTEHKPIKHTIGGDIDNANKQYSTVRIKIKKGDVFYLFSDGYPDQFGGPKEKKFKYSNLLNKLLAIHLLPLEEQKERLESTFNEWKGQLEQIDDVSIIGLRI